MISVDTKAKEWLGNRDRPGRVWRPGKNPIRVDCHTFTTSDQPVVIPYGIYDIARNTGWVNVGTDHDTGELAAESTRRWWQQRGRNDHPDALRLLITADCGGFNDPRRWTWKKHLAAFALESGLEITVCHSPPTVLPHHRELARQTPDQLPGRHRDHRRHDHSHRLRIGAELGTGPYDLGTTLAAVAQPMRS